jgi:hypothetical protein
MGSPEFKPQYLKKKKNERERIKIGVRYGDSYL